MVGVVLLAQLRIIVDSVVSCVIVLSLFEFVVMVAGIGSGIAIVIGCAGGYCY